MPEQNSIGEKMSNFIFSLDEYAQMRAWAPFERDSQLQVERRAVSYFIFLFSVSRTKKEMDMRPFKNAFVINTFNVFVLPGFCYQSRQLRSEDH